MIITQTNISFATTKRQVNSIVGNLKAMVVIISGQENGTKLINQ